MPNSRHAVNVGIIIYIEYILRNLFQDLQDRYYK